MDYVQSEVRLKEGRDRKELEGVLAGQHSLSSLHQQPSGRGVFGHSDHAPRGTAGLPSPFYCLTWTKCI